MQLYSDEARSLARFDARLAPYRNANVSTNLWDALMYAMVDGVTSITMALMLWYGSAPWFEGAVTAGLLNKVRPSSLCWPLPRPCRKKRENPKRPVLRRRKRQSLTQRKSSSI